MDLERRLYLRLFSFCIGGAMDIISYFIDTCILKHTDFDLFLNKHKHEMFHRWISSVPCCECVASVSIAAPHKRSTLIISQMKTIYKLDGTEVTGHVITNHLKETTQHCLCKVSAVPGITTENLDIGLIHCLIKTCSHSVFRKVQSHLEIIRIIRNDLAHHDKRGIMTEIEFNQKWNDLENAVLAIAKEISVSFFRYEKKLITALKKTDVNLDDITDKIEYLEENMKKEFKAILAEQNKINDVIQSKTDKIKQEILEALEKQKDDLSIEIKKLTFAVKLHGIETEVKSEIKDTLLYQREDQEKTMEFKREPSGSQSSESQPDAFTEKCQVEWRLKTPDTWKVEQIKQTLENVSQMLRQWFYIEFIYVGSLVLHTSVPRHVLRDRQFLKSAIQSFLEKIVEVCEINTDITETVHVDFRVLDILNTETLQSEVEKLKNLPIKRDPESATDQDVIRCKHCHKTFPCVQCTLKRKQLGFLEEDISRKSQTIADMEREFMKVEPESDDDEKHDTLQITKDSELLEQGEPPQKLPTLQAHVEDAATTRSTQLEAEYITWLKAKIEFYIKRVSYLENNMTKSRRTKNRLSVRLRQKPNIQDRLELVRANQTFKKQKRNFGVITQRLECYRIALQSQGKPEEIGQLEEGHDTTEKESPDKIMCQLCASDPKSAVNWCTECEQAMCRECTNVHRTQPASLTHQIILFLSDYHFQIKGIYIYDIVSLNNGEVIISCFHQKQLILCDITGDNIEYIPLSVSTHRLTIIDHNTVAVTTTNFESVLIVDVRKKIVTTEINIKANCYTILYINDHLYVDSSDKSLVVLNMSGEIIRTVKLSFTPRRMCGTTEGRIYCIGYRDTVHCIDTEGNTVFTVSNPNMSNTFDITTDHEGHVLVVCKGSESVHRISPDGKFCTVIIMKDQTFTCYPHICYDLVSKSIVIGRDDTIYVYKT